MNEPSSYSVNSFVSSWESCSSPAAVVVVTAYDVGNGFSRRSIIVIYARNIYLRHTSVDPWNRFVSLCFALLGSCCRLSKTVGDSLSDNKMKIPIAEQASNFTSTTTLPSVNLYRYSFQKRLNSKIIKQLMWLQLLFVTSCRIHRYNSFASTTSTQSACFLFLSPASCCSSAYGFVLLIWGMSVSAYCEAAAVP